MDTCDASLQPLPQRLLRKWMWTNLFVSVEEKEKKTNHGSVAELRGSLPSSHVLSSYLVSFSRSKLARLLPGMTQQAPLAPLSCFPPKLCLWFLYGQLLNQNWGQPWLLPLFIPSWGPLLRNRLSGLFGGPALFKGCEFQSPISPPCHNLPVTSYISSVFSMATLFWKYLGFKIKQSPISIQCYLQIHTDKLQSSVLTRTCLPFLVQMLQTDQLKPDHSG